MRTRSVWACLVSTVLLAGCAAGSGPDEEMNPQRSNLGRDQPVEGDLYIEVSDFEGKPVWAEHVEVMLDGEEAEAAVCFQKEGELCTGWIAPFSATERVTVWAQRCGFRFGAPVSLAHTPRGHQDLAITVPATADVCPPVRTTP